MARLAIPSSPRKRGSSAWDIKNAQRIAGPREDCSPSVIIVLRQKPLGAMTRLGMSSCAIPISPNRNRGERSKDVDSGENPFTSHYVAEVGGLFVIIRRTRHALPFPLAPFEGLVRRDDRRVRGRLKILFVKHFISFLVTFK